MKLSMGFLFALIVCLAVMPLVASAEVIDDQVVISQQRFSALDDTLDAHVLAYDMLVGDYNAVDNVVYVSWTSFRDGIEQAIVAAFQNGEVLWQTPIPFTGAAYPIAVKLVGGRVIVCCQTVTSSPYLTQVSIAALSQSGTFLYSGNVTPSYAEGLQWRFQLYTSNETDVVAVLWYVSETGSAYFQRVDVAENPPQLLDGNGAILPNGWHANTSAAWKDGQWRFSDGSVALYSISPSAGLTSVDTSTASFWSMFDSSGDSLWGIGTNNGMVLYHVSTSGEINPTDTRTLLSVHSDSGYSFRMSHEQFVTGERWLTTSMIENTPWQWWQVSVGWYDQNTGGTWGFSLPSYNPPVSHAGAISDHVIGLITAGQNTVRFDAWSILDSSYVLSVDSIGPHQIGWGGWSRIFPDGQGGAELFWTTAQGMGPGTLYHYHVPGLQSGAEPEQGNVVTDFSLGQNYPNPFNPSTNIDFELPMAQQVKLAVYNMSGQKVAELVDGRLAAGKHTVRFDGSQHSSGVYLYRIEAGSYVDAMKMILVK